MLLIANGRVLTRDPDNPCLPDGAVVIEGETILAVGPRAALCAEYPDAEALDARGGVIMPGLINAHTHIYSGLARGLSIAGNDPRTFLEILEGTWWNIDRRLSLDMTRACAWATLLECLRNGVTTVFDHHASYGAITGSLFAIADVARRLVVRACLCYEVSERDGMDKCDEAIRENADFARWAHQNDDDMLRAMFGGHALFTLSDKTFEKMVRANDGLTGFHIHVAEGTDDVYDSLRNYGCRPVERLLYNGILGERTLLGHLIHVSPAEMDILVQTGTMAVNNPQSNLNNAVGIAPALQMMHKGVLLGLGTDAYTHDVLESLKAFLLVQRHNAALPNVGWSEAMTALFANNPAIAARCFKKPLGILAPGAAADVVVMDYPAFTPFGADNADGHILFGMSGRSCRTAVVNGRVLYRDRQFVNIDEERINAEIEAQARLLWRALNP